MILRLAPREFEQPLTFDASGCSVTSAKRLQGSCHCGERYMAVSLRGVLSESKDDEAIPYNNYDDPRRGILHSAPFVETHPTSSAL